MFKLIFYFPCPLLCLILLVPFKASTAVVLWYDAVTVHGKLDWQNELNEQNKPFFKTADGIFLNYVWTPTHLTRSYVSAGKRHGDVFAGIDVFGRNTYGGGGFNCSKALAAIQGWRNKSIIPFSLIEIYSVTSWQSLFSVISGLFYINLFFIESTEIFRLQEMMTCLH